MKSAERIIKEKTNDYTKFPSPQLIINAMEDYARQFPEWVAVQIREPQIGDYYVVKIDTKNDSILTTICEWYQLENGNYDWDFKGITHFGEGSTEDAEVTMWLDEKFEELKQPHVSNSAEYIRGYRNGWADRRSGTKKF